MSNIKDFPVIKLYVKEWGVNIRIKVNTSDLVEGKVNFLPMIKAGIFPQKRIIDTFIILCI